MHPRTEMQYTAIKDTDESDDHSSHAETSVGPQCGCFSNHRQIYIFSALSVCISLCFFLASLAILFSRSSNTDCSAQWHMQTPLEASVAADPPVTVRFNGRFWEESAFKGPPNPERDEAWRNLTNNGGKHALEHSHVSKIQIASR